MKKLVAIGGLAVAAACTDQSATQYVGTVMTEASPDSAGSLRLTLFSRTDTSFSGIIEVGRPATGTGSVYAWFEGSELRLTSVAAAGGDTIFWTSKLTDQGLGGKYEVTGGPRVGQGGTWRARLTRGLPATPATLRLPISHTPPALAFWPLLAVFVLVAGVARWIRATPRRLPTDDTPPPVARVFDGPTPGISGWLLLFVIGQVLGLITALVGLSRSRSDYMDSIGVGAVVTGMQALVVLELTTQVLAPLVAVTGTALVVRHHRYAPRFWFGYFAFSVVFLAVDLAMMFHIESTLGRLIGPTYTADAAKRHATAVQIGRALVVSALWAVYWVRSRRVRMTFGVAALDRTALPIPALTEAPDAARTTRSRRRLVLQSLGVLAVVAVLIVGAALMETHVTPYSLPAGDDIRKTVAGHWTWTTDKKGCANAHVVEFSDDGKIMRIVQPSADIARGDDTTTYDIQFATQSTIRGAIRGETRLDAKGKPVIWDLVLVSPNQYRWRRADWKTGGWGYTAGITRCPARTITEQPRRQ